VGLVIGTSLAVFSVYYVGLIGGEELGDRLIVPPFFAMWTPNLIFLAIAIPSALVRRAGSTAHGGDWDELKETAVRLGRKESESTVKITLRTLDPTCLGVACVFPHHADRLPILVIVIDLDRQARHLHGARISPARWRCHTSSTCPRKCFSCCRSPCWLPQSSPWGARPALRAHGGKGVEASRFTGWCGAVRPPGRRVHRRPAAR